MRYRQKSSKLSSLPLFQAFFVLAPNDDEKLVDIFDDISLNIIFLTKSFRIRVEEDLRHILTAGSITRSEVEQFLN